MRLPIYKLVYLYVENSVYYILRDEEKNLLPYIEILTRPGFTIDANVLFAEFR